MSEVYPRLADIYVRVLQGVVDDGDDDLRATYERWFEGVARDGWLSATAGITGDREFVAVQRFVSREAARRSEQAEADSWIPDLSGHLTDLEVRGTSEVATFGEARPHSVGFVQVVQGRAQTMEGVLERVGEHEHHHIREHDLPVLGGLLAHHGDDHFTEVIYYPSPEATTGGEAEELPQQNASMIERIAGHLSGIRYLQIQDPWVHHH